MGIFKASITLRNPVDTHIKKITVNALADSGANHLCLPEHLVMQLGFKELEKREVTYADGRRHLVSYVGPVQIAYANRKCFVGAMVLGDEPLLGAIPMEDMDLIIHPLSRRLVVNPDNPNFAVSICK